MRFREVLSVLEPVILKEVAASRVKYPDIGRTVISDGIYSDLFDTGAVKMCVIEMVKEKKLHIGLCGVILLAEGVSKRRIILA